MSNFFLFLIGSVVPAPINLYVYVHIFFRLPSRFHSHSTFYIIQYPSQSQTVGRGLEEAEYLRSGDVAERPCQGAAVTQGLLSLTLVYRLCTLCIYFTAPLMRLIITPRGVCAMPEQVQRTSQECRQNRNSASEKQEKKKWKRKRKRKLPKSFYSSIHTHTQAESLIRPVRRLNASLLLHSVFCSCRSPSRASFASCAAYAGDLAFGLWLCGIPCQAPPHALFSLRRSLFYNFLIVFASNLCKIAASRRLPSAAQAQIVRLTDGVEGGRGLNEVGAPGPITKPTAMCNIYLKLISVAQLDYTAKLAAGKTLPGAHNTPAIYRHASATLYGSLYVCVGACACLVSSFKVECRVH